MSHALTLLPPSCTATRRGLTLRPGLSREEWLGIGTKISEFAGATSWVLGDFFAYGDQYYTDKTGAKRVPDGLYAVIATEIGCSEQTLRNAKCVCAALPLSRRRDKLTFSHAVEIVGRADPKDFEKWITLVAETGLSTKALREKLRKATADHAPETNDQGTPSFLETARQFVRDYQSAAEEFTPAYRKELAKILEPVLHDLAGRPG